jgi:Tfp pilus assembly protein PilF
VAEQLAASEQACAAAREAGDLSLLAPTLFQRATSLFGLGRGAESVQILEEIVPQLERDENPWHAIFALIMWSYEHELWGEFEQSIQIMDRAMLLAERAGDPLAIISTLSKRGWIAFHSGMFDDARSYLQRATILSASVAESWISAYTPMALGAVCLAAGQVEEARGHLRHAAAVAESHRDRQALRLVHAVLAEDDLLHSRPDAARARLEPLLDAPDQHELDLTAFLWLLAWAYLDLGDDQQAENVIEQNIERARTQTYWRILPEALRVRAMLAMRQQRWDAAEGSLSEALAVARAMPYPYAEAKALYGYGQLHRERGEPESARQCFEHALAILNRLGERFYAERIERDLATE